MRWSRDMGTWRAENAYMRARVSEIICGSVEHRGRWSWQLQCATVSAHGPDTFATAAGAKRACARVARRLGLAC